MTVTRICLVRHGETDWNAERRLQGQLDIPLNGNGRQQADRLAAALKRAAHPFAALYSSDLQRAASTAAPIAQQLGLAVTALPELRERHFGALQGVTLADGPQQQPHAWHGYSQREPAHDLGGGESLLAFSARVRHALARLAAEHLGQSILLVSHGGVLDMAYRLASGQPLTAQRAVPIPNAALNWLGVDAAQWSIIEWADQRHLAQTLDEL